MRHMPPIGVLGTRYVNSATFKALIAGGQTERADMLSVRTYLINHDAWLVWHVVSDNDERLNTFVPSRHV